MNIEKMGSFIREERKKKQLNQKQLAELVQVATTTICKWEKGVNIPDIPNLEKLAGIFEVSIQEILDGEAQKSSEVKHAGNEPIFPPDLSDSPPNSLDPSKPSASATKKRQWKAGIAVSFTFIAMISATITISYYLAHPAFDVIREFCPDTADLGVYAEFYNAEDIFCIIVEYTGNAKADDFECYNSVIYDEYYHIFSENKIISVSYFENYDIKDEAIDSARYQSFLFDIKLHKQEVSQHE